MLKGKKHTQNIYYIEIKWCESEFFFKVSSFKCWGSKLTALFFFQKIQNLTIFVILIGNNWNVALFTEKLWCGCMMMNEELIVNDLTNLVYMKMCPICVLFRFLPFSSIKVVVTTNVSIFVWEKNCLCQLWYLFWKFLV